MLPRSSLSELTYELSLRAFASCVCFHHLPYIYHARLSAQSPLVHLTPSLSRSQRPPPNTFPRQPVTMIAFTRVFALSTLSTVLVSGAPFTKRASLTGSTVNGDVSVHTDYATMAGDMISGACGYPAGAMSSMENVVALEGAFGGPLDKTTQCSACIEIHCE